MKDSHKIIVNVNKGLNSQREKDINLVLILKIKGEQDIPPIFVKEDNWQELLKKEGIKINDPLFSSVEAFFSSHSSHRQKSCLVSVCSENSCIKKFLKTMEEKRTLSSFGAIALVENWQEIDFEEDLLSFCRDKKIFLLANTKELVEIKEDYLILFHHNQEENTFNNGHLLEKYASQLFKKFEENPNSIAQIPLRGTQGLEKSILSSDLKLKFQTNFINQYYKCDRILEVSLGTVMSGETIEDIHFNTRFLEKDIISKVKEWRIEASSSLYSIPLFQSKLEFLMKKYKNKEYLTLSSFDNSEDLRFYSVDRIEIKEEFSLRRLTALIRYSYNYKIKNLIINIIEEIES